MIFRGSLIVLVLSLLTTSCGVYSFTGTTITAETISIQNFYNDANQGPPNLSVRFTDHLRDYFQQNTSLVQVTDEGELQMEGAVSSYRLTPVAPTRSTSNSFGDSADLTRLTVTVSVTYVNLEDETFDFKKSFSHYVDFDNSVGLAALEDNLLEEIFDQIVLDIFNASVANW